MYRLNIWEKISVSFYWLNVISRLLLLTCLIYLSSAFVSITIAAHSDTAYLVERSFNLPNLGENLQVAEAEQTQKDEGEMSATCRKYAADDDANVSELVKAGCEPTLAQMSALMDNPLGNVAMLFTQFDYTRLRNGDNKKTAKQGLYTGIAQFPLSVGEEWNIINRVIWTVPSVPISQSKIDRFQNGRTSGGIPPGGGPITPPAQSGIAPIDVFDGRTTDFGDIYYVGLFSPKDPIKLDNGAKVVWGLGFDLAFPTAQEEILGSGKYSAGPSALGVYLGPKWKFGALVQQYWDYASDEKDRDDVNLTNIQSIYYYSLDSTTSIGAGPNIIMNWEQDSDNFLTLPVGTGISKTLQFGKVPVRIGTEVHYSVIRPDDEIGSDWNLRFYIIPAVPSAFIPILN